MFRVLFTVIAVWAVLIMIGFLHYTLPQRDIVRITGTEIIRTDFSGWNRIFYAQADSAATDSGNRDLRLINAVRPNGKVIVFRNEDTGLFNWPPYIKVNSADIHAEASDATSTRDEPSWFIVRHYGWRSTWFSIYPNALTIKPATGPDQRLIPWFNLIFFLVMFAIAWAIFVRIRRFWNRRVDPIIDQVDASVDETRDWVTGFWKR
ncbi:MAG: DUF1523 family protein [Pseudomonadota bacterium]